MTELKLQPITGPGEYTQRNGKMAEIVGQDKDGNWLGWVVLNAGARVMGFWLDTGRARFAHTSCDVVQPKPEIEIPEELRHAMLDAYDEAADGFFSELEAVARVAIAWDRANRPKREPTKEDYDACYRAYQSTHVADLPFQVAVRRAFELAQEPK